MLKQIFKSAAYGGAFGLSMVLTAALAIQISGRETSARLQIAQVGISAMTPELGITATAAGTQVTAYQLTAGVNQVTTVATAGDAVKLPSVTALGAPTNVDASLNVIIANNTATSMNVFPFASTDVIVSNGVAAGAGAALAIATLKSADCWSVSTGRWYCTVG